MKIFLMYFSIAFLIVSCTTSREVCKNNLVKKRIKISVEDFKLGFTKGKYFLILPKGYEEIKIVRPESTDIVFKYLDQSFLYLNNDKWSGSSLNSQNLSRDVTSVKRQNFEDSLFFRGTQDDGLFWRQDFLNEIVVGYANVPQERVKEFDKYIESIERIR